MFDFFKRKPSAKSASASRAIMTADPEVDRLRAQIAAKQTQAAGLEADLMESRESLAAFQREFETRLGPFIARVNELQAQVKAARRALLRQMWEANRFAPKFVDVEEQFRTAWTETEPPPPPPPSITPNVEAQIKALYRELAKRYHPDLAATDAEREWRTPRMTAVNAVYAARDLAALQKFAAQKDDGAMPAPKIDSREALMASLKREIERLDELIEKLERDFDELTNSPALQMQLNASMAKRARRDLIAEAAAELQKEIRELEKELKELGN